MAQATQCHCRKAAKEAAIFPVDASVQMPKEETHQLADRHHRYTYSLSKSDRITLLWPKPIITCDTSRVSQAGH